MEQTITIRELVRKCVDLREKTKATSETRVLMNQCINAITHLCLAVERAEAKVPAMTITPVQERETADV